MGASPISCAISSTVSLVAVADTQLDAAIELGKAKATGAREWKQVVHGIAIHLLRLGRWQSTPVQGDAARLRFEMLFPSLLFRPANRFGNSPGRAAVDATEPE